MGAPSCRKTCIWKHWFCSAVPLRIRHHLLIFADYFFVPKKDTEWKHVLLQPWQLRLVYLQVTLQIVRDITFGCLPRKMGDEPANFRRFETRKSIYHHLVLLIYSYENKFMAFHGTPNGLRGSRRKVTTLNGWVRGVEVVVCPDIHLVVCKADNGC